MLLTAHSIMKWITSLYILILIFYGVSCVSHESLVNYDNTPTIPSTPQSILEYPSLVIQTDDILHIGVSSSEELAARPFIVNNATPMGGGGMAGGGNNVGAGMLINGYLVNEAGEITFPTIGKIQLGGLEMEEARAKILSELEPYFEEPPIVKIRLLNFRVNVSGEVRRPGVFQVQNERITIVEAITLAGDFTDYSDRDSVLIMRETNGERKFGYISFESAELFNSPYFYLQQNDVIYVRPIRRKVGVVNDPANQIFRWISAITGTAAFIISITRNR